jgi:hypothetical protein
MKTIESGAIALTQSFSMVSGPCLLSAMQTSASLSASAMPPSRCSSFVIWQYFHLSTHSALTALMSSRFLCRMPLLSTTRHSAGVAPYAKISRLMATLAAPEPMKAILTSSIFLPTT